MEKHNSEDYECHTCKKKFKTIKYLNQHMHVHQNSEDYECHICKKKFKAKKYLNQHMQVHTKKHKCKYCDTFYSFLHNLKRHERIAHGLKHPQCFKNNHNGETFTCHHCHNEFDTYKQLVNHIEQYHPLKQTGGRRETNSSKQVYDASAKDDNRTDANKEDVNKEDDNRTDNNKEDDVSDEIHSSKANSDLHQNDQESALRNTVQNRFIFPRRNERYDLLPFLANSREEIVSYLKTRARQLGGIKWNVCVQVEMQRDDGYETTVSSPYFRSTTYRFLYTEDLQDHDVNEAFQKIFAALEKYQREGSNWFLKKILKLEIHTVVYQPLRGSTYIPLPKTLARSKSLLNIKNEDNKCFLYCILASLHPQQLSPENPQLYEPFQHEVVMNGIQYPVTLSDISKFERRNDNISINVFGFDEESIIPLRITHYNGRLHHINLLWLKGIYTSHYCLILDLNRFLSRTKTCRNQTHFCPYCLHGFIREDLLSNHNDYCSPHGPQKVILPSDESDKILKFKEYSKTLKMPFTIYSDFETVNVKLHTCMQNPAYSSTTPTTKLEACGFAYKVVCEDSNYTKPTVVYRGPNAAEKLIQCLLEEDKQIKDILSHIEPMLEHEGLVDSAECCCLCKTKFTLYDKTYKKIVVHHNHLTGEIIGVACNSCNLNCKQSKITPVFFHNLRNFDSHILALALSEFPEYRLSCIPQTSERYVSFSLGSLRFLDSFQFLPSSLETLVDNLKQDGIEAFPHLLSEFKQREEAELLVRKGIYPYEYMDAFHRFDEKELPPIEKFYSSIKKEGISENEYAHAHKVFQNFNMLTLGDYHDLYVKTDVLLLADVFESFRKVCLSQYELDPCHFYTSPGLSWSSLLKMTGVELELITDIDQLLMIEAGTRGGLSQISNRFKKANNPYLDDYDPSHTTSYLIYYDANNLYGWAMVQPLPVGGFQFLDDVESFDVMTIKEDGDIGFILEVSLHYPPELHDLHNCLPLAPEQEVIPNNKLSPYAQKVLKKLYGLNDNDSLPTRGEVKKLLATVADKSNYILHYRNLQLYIKLGMKIKEIHRILQFRQSPWMKSYIEFNTEMRKRAKSTFEKNFYKLMNVSVFGKTLQNERKYKNIELVHQKERLRKVSAKPTYKNTTIFNENLVAVELLRSQVKLFKPSYCGMCILDLSKCLMYDFWYGYIKKTYGNKAQLQMTDTDSFLFYCETDDVYQDMLLSMDLFDTSDYPEDHFLHSVHNKKVLGKMKDETKGLPISEFVGLRSKMYSYMCNGEEEKRAKGVSKVTVKKDLKHEHFKLTLFDESKRMSTMTSIRSHRHELFCETINKAGLSAFDDKRFLLNSVESYAYSHYKTRNENLGELSLDSSVEMNENAFEHQSSLVEDPSTQIVGISVQDEPLFFENQMFTSNEKQSFFLNNVKITPVQSEPLVFENQAFAPIEDQSFFLINAKITPCE